VASLMRPLALLIHHPFVLVLPAASHGHLLLSFFGRSCGLDLGLEELKNHYHQYDDHHYPDDPVLRALTSSGRPSLRHIGHKEGGGRYTAVLCACYRSGAKSRGPYRGTGLLEEAATGTNAHARAGTFFPYRDAPSPDSIGL
jgi:hypothetical protein